MLAAWECGLVVFLTSSVLAVCFDLKTFILPQSFRFLLLRWQLSRPSPSSRPACVHAASCAACLGSAFGHTYPSPHTPALRAVPLSQKRGSCSEMKGEDTADAYPWYLQGASVLGGIALYMRLCQHHTVLPPHRTGVLQKLEQSSFLS